jgi:hypothetical protein
VCSASWGGGVKVCCDGDPSSVESATMPRVVRDPEGDLFVRPEGTPTRCPPVADEGPPPWPGVAVDKGTLLNPVTEAACRHGPSGLPDGSEDSWRRWCRPPPHGPGGGS